MCGSQTDAAYSRVVSTITKELYVLSLTSLLQPYVLCLRKSSVLEALAAKIASMIRKYYYHKLRTNLWHREEEPHNNHETPGRQTKQGNQLSLPHQDDCKNWMDTKQHTTKYRTTTVTNPLIKALRQSRHWVWGLTHRRAIKEHTRLSLQPCIQAVAW